MDNKELKSFRVVVTLKEYLKLNNIISDKTFNIGNITYNNVKHKLQCQRKGNNGIVTLIGENAHRTDICLFEESHSIIELNNSSVELYVDVVLKEQVK